MRIAIVNRHPEDVLGGSELQCDNIATGLAQKGHDVVYIAPSGRDGFDYQRAYKVVVTKPHWKDIAQATLEQKPNIIYWRLNKYHFRGAAKSFAKHGVPVVFAISHINDTKPWSHVDNPKNGPISFLKAVKQGLRNVINHRGFKYVSGITSMNTDFLGRISVPHERYIPDSVDMTVVPFSWPRPYVVWVANLKPAKQPEKYVELARHFADSGVDFLMIGSIHSKEFDWIRDENKRTPNFHYLGPKNIREVNGVLEKSLMLVHTCKPEGFGNNFIQAWLLKKPTVSLSFDPQSHITNNNLGGYANSDWNLFTRQVAALLDNPAERQVVGERAYDFALPAFSIEKTIADNERFALEIIQKSVP